MKFMKEQRIKTGHKIHESSLSNFNDAKRFDIAEENTRRYRIMYEQAQGLEHNSSKSRKDSTNTSLSTTPF